MVVEDLEKRHAALTSTNPLGTLLYCTYTAMTKVFTHVLT